MHMELNTIFLTALASRNRVVKQVDYPLKIVDAIKGVITYY